MTPPRLSRSELTRFLKFSVVGTFGAVVDFGTFNVLHGSLSWPAVAASVCSFLAAVISNFIWNRYWTYPDSRTKSVRRQAGQFALVSLVGLAIRTPLFALLIGPGTSLASLLLQTRLGSITDVTAAALGSNLALAAAVIVVLFWNFLANRLWTYADIDRQRSRPAARSADTPPV